MVYEELFKDENGLVQKNTELLAKTKEELIETNDLRLFYQKLVMKLTRDL